MNRSLLTLASIMCAAPLAMAIVASSEPGPGTGQPGASGVFTADQASAGTSVYSASCASCHMADLAGRNEAPQLAGGNFMNTWRARSTKDLFEFIQSTMPPTGENLSAAQYAAVTAYILQANGARAGATALGATTAVPIGSVATGVATTTAGAAPAAARGAAPAGRQGAPGGAGQAPGGGRGGAAVNAGPLGVTVQGTVKNYTPVTDEMLRNQDPGDWLMARRNYQGWSHSPLTQITTGNAKDLQLAWSWGMSEGQGNEPSPLIHNGVLYLVNIRTSSRRSTRGRAT